MAGTFSAEIAGASGCRPARRFTAPGRLFLRVAETGVTPTSDLDDRDDRVVPFKKPCARHQRKAAPRPTSVPATTFGEISGKAHVIDGDTIVIKRTKIRLAGIDAPELDQPFGQKSKWAMVESARVRSSP